MLKTKMSQKQQQKNVKILMYTIIYWCAKYLVFFLNYGNHVFQNKLYFLQKPANTSKDGMYRLSAMPLLCAHRATSSRGDIYK